MTSRIIVFVLSCFTLLFILTSIGIMLNVSFYDFDEAHRAEKAKRMKEYMSLVPLTGSVFDRNENHKIHFRDNGSLYLYYHLERPPLVYWLMMVSTSLVGNGEFSYRLPSFLFGAGTMAAFLMFTSRWANFLPVSIGFLILITSADLWLSSQYAQLDTALTFFLFNALILLILFCQKRTKIYLFFSAINLGLAILSKGQPAVIFLIPLIFLLLLRKISFKELVIFCGFTFAIILPYFTYLSARFGFIDLLKDFIGFGFVSATSPYLHLQAPFFWYGRWWLESLRPGWILFLSLVVYDIFKLNFNWVKSTLLIYIFLSWLFYSYWNNKIWWYILPLIPVTASYISISALEYLSKNSQKILNISVVIILASLPVFLQVTNTYSIIYGIVIGIISVWILHLRITFSKPAINIILILSILISLLSFYYHFPKIIPFHHNTKYAGSFFKNQVQPKCLWVLEMPVETPLFYSDAGQVEVLTEAVIASRLYKDCRNNYLMTPVSADDLEQKKYIPRHELIFQRGTMKLYRLEKTY